MAVDIGAEAINRGSNHPGGYTLINKDHPSTISGTITSIDIWAFEDITGLRVGTFNIVSGNTLKCRVSQAITGTITAGSKVTKALSIAVEIDDYIGCYFTGGRIERDISGYVALWRILGEYIDPDDEALYTALGGDIMSLGGYISVAGWTGKISGVTNPGKVMKVDVANIGTVKGA